MCSDRATCLPMRGSGAGVMPGLAPQITAALLRTGQASPARCWAAGSPPAPAAATPHLAGRHTNLSDGFFLHLRSDFLLAWKP